MSDLTSGRVALSSIFYDNLGALDSISYYNLLLCQT